MVTDAMIDTDALAKTPRFALGQIALTPGAFRHLSIWESVVLLRRHVSGDWGELGRDDKKENDFSVDNGFRILSAYTIRGVKLWVITEADRSSTTILLPEEY